MNTLYRFGISMLTLFVLCAAAWADSQDPVKALQDHWAVANYQSEGKQRKQAFEDLTAEADKVVASMPDTAEAHIWAGIVYSTYAGEVSMFKAGKQVKRAREELEHALQIDPQAMQGSAYTSLGALLFQIPGFMGGDDEEAENMLLKGIELNPDGIDSNYFYGTFLLDQDRSDEAEQFLRKAQSAPPRPGRELADNGRQKEIADALQALR